MRILNFFQARPRASAVLVFAALTAAILFANFTLAAATPGAGASGRYGNYGPGYLGVTRFQLAKVGVDRVDIDDNVARLALRGVPLASEPFTALAARSLMNDPRGQTGSETKLLEEALRRDPRSRTARMLLLRQMAATGDLGGAFDQLAILNRLNSRLVETIMEAITTRITTPQQVDDALKAISGHDELYQPFVNRMTGKRKPPEVVLRLAERLPERVMARPTIRNAVIRQLVDAREFSAARNLWQQGNRGGTSGHVHSPDFRDTVAPPPFNWQLFVDSTGAAERQRDGGISVIYYDRNPGPLATQLLTLAPGSYAATAEFEVVSGQADNVRLQLRCEGTNAVLAEGALIATKPRINTIRLNAMVPGNGCSGQVLAVVGSASDQRGQTQLIIQRVDISAGGAGK